jgi:hypothetical protein
MVHGESRGREYHEGQIGGLAMEVQISVMLRDLMVFWMSHQQYLSGGGNTREVQSLTYRCENLRSDLNWLCMAMAFLKAFFWE